eukprot:15460799-Alexandrium_andersonii.AAC.1
MAELARDPYRTARLGTSGLQNRVVQFATEEPIGYPSPGTRWTASGKDPAEVAEEAGGSLAVPSEATRTFWDDVINRWTTGMRGPNATAWL